MVMPDPYRPRMRVSTSVAAGALIGLVVVLWWRWVRAVLAGAALGLALFATVGLLVGLGLHGDRLHVVLVAAGVLGFWGAVVGMLIWSQRAGRPRWLGRGWWPVYASGGLVVGALTPVAVIGMETAAALTVAVVCGGLGLFWALVTSRTERTRPAPPRFDFPTGADGSRGPSSGSSHAPQPAPWDSTRSGPAPWPPGVSYEDMSAVWLADLPRFGLPGRGRNR